MLIPFLFPDFCFGPRVEDFWSNVLAEVGAFQRDGKMANVRRPKKLNEEGSIYPVNVDGANSAGPLWLDCASLIAIHLWCGVNWDFVNLTYFDNMWRLCFIKLASPKPKVPKSHLDFWSPRSKCFQIIGPSTSSWKWYAFSVLKLCLVFVYLDFFQNTIKRNCIELWTTSSMLLSLASEIATSQLVPLCNLRWSHHLSGVNQFVLRTGFLPTCLTSKNVQVIISSKV